MWNWRSSVNDENALLIERLERANRRTRWFSALLIFLILVLVLALWRIERKDVLQAKEFILKDESGEVVARLGHKNLETCLELTGKRQASAASLCVGDDYGSSLLLTN
jgi:cbb3-type cytochrome oxidase subunit 3